MNGHGDALLSREVGEDIERVRAAKAAHEKCEVAKVVPPAVIRALRMSEMAWRDGRINKWLIVALLVLAVKGEAWPLVLKVFKVMGMMP